LEVDAERVVEFGHQACRKTPDHGAESLDRDRANLFGLGFRIHVDARFGSGEENLKEYYHRSYHGSFAASVLAG